MGLLEFFMASPIQGVEEVAIVAGTAKVRYLKV
jgi:hypothetical protein